MKASPKSSSSLGSWATRQDSSWSLSTALAELPSTLISLPSNLLSMVTSSMSSSRPKQKPSSSGSYLSDVDRQKSHLGPPSHLSSTQVTDLAKELMETLSMATSAQRDGELDLQESECLNEAWVTMGQVALVSIMSSMVYYVATNDE